MEQPQSSSRPGSPKQQSLAARMKEYEATTTALHLEHGVPAVMRLDGHSFSRFTARFQKPFDSRLHTAMVATCADLLGSYSTATLAYTQSDEITLVFPTGFGSFNGRVQKIATLAASFCSVHFYTHLLAAMAESPEPAVTGFGPVASATGEGLPLPHFDARVFNVPSLEECLNNLLWRCRGDAIRNSVSAWARSLYSTKQLHKKITNELIAMAADERGVIYKDSVPAWALEGTIVKREMFEHEGKDLKTGQPAMTMRTRTRAVNRGVTEFSEENLCMVREKYWPPGMGEGQLV